MIKEYLTFPTSIEYTIKRKTKKQIVQCMKHCKV